jgi:protein ImuB
VFAAIYVPDFPVEALVRAEPMLREQAVAVLDGTPPLLTVLACNQRARLAGIECAMTRVQAEALPEVKLRQRSHEQESAAHAALLDCACAFSPRVEDTAPDTLIADIAGLERLFGPPAQLARDLARRAADLGLEANVAVAADPDAAMHAARGFSGVTLIEPGHERDRLGTLPVDVLFMGKELPSGAPPSPPPARVGSTDWNPAEILETLDRWGVRTFRALASLPPIPVTERLGQRGLYLQKLAAGATRRTIVPAEPPLHFEEAIEMEYPVDLLEPLAFVLARLLEQLCARLSARSLATNELRLRMRLTDFRSDESTDLPAAENNSSLRSVNPSIAEEFTRTLKLPVPMNDAKTFLKLLQLDLQAHPPSAPVAKIWLAAEPVRPRHAQTGLFLPEAPAPERLELTLARIGGVVGEQNVGSPEVLDTHRPDAFRMQRFSLAEAARGQLSALRTHATPLALRVFRPPRRAKVQIKSGKPVHVWAPGVCGDIVACAGPWRTSGEWWTDSPWHRDEWDIAVHNDQGTSLYRLYQDVKSKGWFVYGTYD